ncbi:hypothetical protein K402DRAFT_135654 [Aulographum hederae CBS 113979]|uniref:Uncharacterized protein n=1 Tax=Aulographum hederae CBS 113979 TaxID=1176131 RepID=A0A6G1GVE1_9PEZI|nr:hypothetical protein K402DRAFT_135654 [Aulographum hederae CBS 113979]
MPTSTLLSVEATPQVLGPLRIGLPCLSRPQRCQRRRYLCHYQEGNQNSCYTKQQLMRFVSLYPISSQPTPCLLDCVISFLSFLTFGSISIQTLPAGSFDAVLPLPTPSPQLGPRPCRSATESMCFSDVRVPTETIWSLI